MVPAEPRGVVVVIDGLPVELLEQELPNLPLLQLAGIEPAEYGASDTVRIADGAWSPGVLR